MRPGDAVCVEAVILPLTDVLDLHSFRPEDVPAVVSEYLEEARRAGLAEVRIVHGRGRGVQRAVVRRLLGGAPGVAGFADAEPTRGGMGSDPRPPPPAGGSAVRVRTVAVALLVGGVLGASALDLVLGALWVVALVAVLLLRRRLRLAAPLVLVASLGADRLGRAARLVLAPRAGALREGLATGLARVPAGARAGRGSARSSPLESSWQVLRREQLRLTGAELEQRAGAVILLARRLDALRSEAPREVAAVEGAARRLARTLAAPEFRNLEARRAAEAALSGGARPPPGRGSAMRARRPRSCGRRIRRRWPTCRCDPCATTSRPPARRWRRSCGRWGAACRRRRSRRRRGTTRPAARSPGRCVTPSPARPAPAWSGSRRAPFRSAAPPGRSLSLALRRGRRGAPSGAARRVAGARAERSAACRSSRRGPSRRSAAADSLDAPVTHVRSGSTLAPSTAAEDALVATVLDGHPGIEMPLAVRLPPPSLARVTVPRHALYFASGPGAGDVGAGWGRVDSRRRRHRTARDRPRPADALAAEPGLRGSRGRTSFDPIR